MALGAWLLLQTTDSFWLGTLLAFGPRWALLLPVGLAALLSLLCKRWALLPVTLAGMVVVWPVMGWCVGGWGRVSDQKKVIASQGPAIGSQGGKENKFRVLTCNTLQGRAEEGLKELIWSDEPDVVVMQEWPGERAAPVSGEDGWDVGRAGGIVICSRWPIAMSEPLVSPARSWHTIGLRCEILTPSGRVQLVGLHLLTPRDGLEAVLSSRWRGLDGLAQVTEQRQVDGIALERWLNEMPGPKIVAGDCNMTVESVIYRQRLGYLQNAFSVAGWGWGGTKFTRVHSVRIDHVLCDEHWRVERCEVGPNLGSDHRPVMAVVSRK